MTIQTDTLADKYETKRTGLTFDEACEAAVMGYRVRCPSLQPEAYVHYQFDGLRIQFVHNGREGSSSGWQGDRQSQLDEWQIVPLPSELKRDAWGVPISNPGGDNIPANFVTGDVDAGIDDYVDAIKRDSWGRPV